MILLWCAPGMRQWKNTRFAEVPNSRDYFLIVYGSSITASMPKEKMLKIF